jgi:hypothetical protein
LMSRFIPSNLANASIEPTMRADSEMVHGLLEVL